MKPHFKILLTAILMLVSVHLVAQEDKIGIVRYKMNHTVVDENYLENELSSQAIHTFFLKAAADTNIQIKCIELFTSASPEGTVDYNQSLNRWRAIMLADYIASITNVPDSIFVHRDIGIGWAKLREMVSNSDMKYRDEVLDILDNVPVETYDKGVLVDSRNKHLMDLKGGVPYNYMRDKFFPYLRYTEIYVDRDTTQVYEGFGGDPIVVSDETPEEDNLHVDTMAVKEDTGAYGPENFLAVKTNLLFLGGGVANIGVEGRIAKKMTIDVPFVYSPYTIHKNYKMRFLALQPEFRFWFDKAFTGHFLGLHGNFGWFNVAVDDDNRYQDRNDRPVMGAGLTYGYAWNVTDCLSLEFLIGAGYANIHYDVFYNVPNGISYSHGVKNYFGITRLGVNLVYNIKMNRGR